MAEDATLRSKNVQEEGVNLKDAIPLVRSKGMVLVLNTAKGRGVFAQEFIPSRTILEVCPVLVLDPQENELHVRKTDLYNYTYNWPYNSRENPRDGDKPSPKTTQALILGLGSMFNHSKYRQNVGWTRDVDNLTITYATLRDIHVGEELCISYGERLTFVDADALIEESKENENGDEDWAGKIELDELIQ